MKRTMAILGLLLLLGSCGGGGGAKVDDLQRSNDDLKARVKSLEDQLLQTDKKLIQHDQAFQAMAERLRNLESNVDKLTVGH
jgi:outer membrane murein-binding lipoprotein Lpp